MHFQNNLVKYLIKYILSFLEKDLHKMIVRIKIHIQKVKFLKIIINYM